MRWDGTAKVKIDLAITGAARFCEAWAREVKAEGAALNHADFLDAALDCRVRSNTAPLADGGVSASPSTILSPLSGLPVVVIATGLFLPQLVTPSIQDASPTFCGKAAV